LFSVLAGWLAFFLDLAVVLIARNKVNDQANITAHIGNALWMALGGMVSEA
jgi:hypothetical protein